jgi:hypothetical protein
MSNSGDETGRSSCCQPLVEREQLEGVDHDHAVLGGQADLLGDTDAVIVANLR